MPDGDSQPTAARALSEPLVPEAAPPPMTDEPIAAPPFVYAIGRVEPRFPSPGVEKELAQVTGRTETRGLTDRGALQAVLAERPNRYLARQLTWVLTIEGLETYLLVPRDPTGLDQLIEAVRPRPRGDDLDVVIGLRGPIAAPEMANGLMVPIVFFDQIYSFDVDALVSALPRPDGVDESEFAATAEELLARVMQLADNAGAIDEHRALNYLAVRYDAIYAKTAEAHARNASLTSVEVRPSRLTGVRRIVDVIFSYTDRQTDTVESYFTRVDATEQFPFLVTKLSPYFER